jgi:hypothetical protein
MSQFTVPEENQVAKPFPDLNKYHGLHDGYEVDAGNFIFALRCLQAAYPPTLFFHQFAVPVHSAKSNIACTLEWI